MSSINSMPKNGLAARRWTSKTAVIKRRELSLAVHNFSKQSLNDFTSTYLRGDTHAGIGIHM
jgi:hypothetical protein